MCQLSGHLLKNTRSEIWAELISVETLDFDFYEIKPGI